MGAIYDPILGKLREGDRMLYQFGTTLTANADLHFTNHFAKITDVEKVTDVTITILDSAPDVGWNASFYQLAAGQIIFAAENDNVSIPAACKSAGIGSLINVYYIGIFDEKKTWRIEGGIP